MTFFLENSRPTACYFQWNSKKLFEYMQLGYTLSKAIRTTGVNLKIALWDHHVSAAQKIYLCQQNQLTLSHKSSQLFISSRRIYISSIKLFFFLDLDCQNLATLDFGICQISKKNNLISEMKILLSEMKLRYRAFLALRS